VHRPDQARVLYGALLLLDGHGRPLEFIHNRLVLPSGFLWPEERVLPAGLASLCHSLFDACRGEPDLLLVEAGLAEPAFLAKGIAPNVPFGIVGPGQSATPEVSWVNGMPGAAMPAGQLLEEVAGHGLLAEPFHRAYLGLAETYGAEIGPAEAE
jgi:hypothetical protein